jgi:hypothetical protein
MPFSLDRKTTKNKSEEEWMPKVAVKYRYTTQSKFSPNSKKRDNARKIFTVKN